MSTTQPLVMGIDYGEARIGLALSDALAMLAHPLETVPGHDKKAAVARIAQLVNERAVSKVILGLPLRMDGSEGSAVERVRKFSKLLRPLLPEEVEIIEVDERLSTVSAMEKMHAAGRTEKNSRRQIDQAAAMEILQDYLDGQAGGLLPNPWEDEDDRHDR
ncbi:MAG: Holliday junction resolvase RuvX [Verrucomicrobiae bacterium]|nr:Holliday junction resolvase RuvX [Verrucomicrobiae bacterium]